jgi:hypothetical protein
MYVVYIDILSLSFNRLYGASVVPAFTAVRDESLSGDSGRIEDRRSQIAAAYVSEKLALFALPSPFRMHNAALLANRQS